MNKVTKVRSITKTKDPLEYVKRIETIQKGQTYIQVLGSDTFVTRVVGLVETREAYGDTTSVYLNSKQLRELATACETMADLLESAKYAKAQK